MDDKILKEKVKEEDEKINKDLLMQLAKDMGVKGCYSTLTNWKKKYHASWDEVLAFKEDTINYSTIEKEANIEYLKSLNMDTRLYSNISQISSNRHINFVEAVSIYLENLNEKCLSYKNFGLYESFTLHGEYFANAFEALIKYKISITLLIYTMEHNRYQKWISIEDALCEILSKDYTKVDDRVAFLYEMYSKEIIQEPIEIEYKPYRLNKYNKIKPHPHKNITISEKEFKEKKFDAINKENIRKTVEFKRNNMIKKLEDTYPVLMHFLKSYIIFDNNINYLNHRYPSYYPFKFILGSKESKVLYDIDDFIEYVESENNDIIKVYGLAMYYLFTLASPFTRDLEGISLSIKTATQILKYREEHDAPLDSTELEQKIINTVKEEQERIIQEEKEKREKEKELRKRKREENRRLAEERKRKTESEIKRICDELYLSYIYDNKLPFILYNFYKGYLKIQFPINEGGVSETEPVICNDLVYKNVRYFCNHYNLNFDEIKYLSKISNKNIDFIIQNKVNEIYNLYKNSYTTYCDRILPYYTFLGKKAFKTFFEDIVNKALKEIDYIEIISS